MSIYLMEGEGKMRLTIQVFKSGKNYVANCPEFDVYSFAATKEKAVWRLKKVCSFYIDFAKEAGISFDELAGILHNKQIMMPDLYYRN